MTEITGPLPPLTHDVDVVPVPEFHAVTDRVVVRLTNPLLSWRDVVRTQNAFALILGRDAHWPLTWAAALLRALAFGLPLDDPWWRIRGSVRLVGDVHSVPCGVEAAGMPDGVRHPGGQAFGTILDAADVLSSGHHDPARDMGLAPFDERLSVWSAFLIAQATHPRIGIAAMAVTATQMLHDLALRGEPDPTEVMADVLVDALRWLVWRRCVYAEDQAAGAQVVVLAHVAAQQMADWLTNVGPQSTARIAGPPTDVAWADFAAGARDGF